MRTGRVFWEFLSLGECWRHRASRIVLLLWPFGGGHERDVPTLAVRVGRLGAFALECPSRGVAWGRQRWAGARGWAHRVPGE